MVELSGERAGRPVGVVVVTFESEAALGGLLETLDAGMEGCEWELVVADNGSADESVALVRTRRPDATVIELDANRGYAAALNRGIEALDPGSDVLALNPDLRLARSFARTLQDALGDGEAGRVGIAAPRLLEPSGDVAPSLRREPAIRRALAETFVGVRRAGRLGWGEAVLDPSAYGRPTVADWASGAALMIWRECLEACGPWDESFFLYSEETEFALRARERGYLTRLVPEAVATHAGGASRDDPELWARLVLNKLALYRRRHGRALAASFRLASLVREIRLGMGGNPPSWTASRALLRGSDRR